MITLAEKLLMGINKPSNGYVEFVSSTPMSITPKYTNSGVTLQYSLNGISWTTIASSATTPSANVIYFRGKATLTKALFTSNASSNAWVFTGATNLEVYGKFDRLIQDILGSDNDILNIGNTCFSSMFYNVSTLVYVDEDCLPATTVARGCYQYMFKGCTSLTTLPSLPATKLTDSCYYEMFRSCASIKLSTTQSSIYDTPYRIPSAGTGTTSTGALTRMFTSTGGAFTGDIIINKTYYTENTPV